MQTLRHLRMQKSKYYQALGKKVYSKYGNETPESTGAPCDLNQSYFHTSASLQGIQLLLQNHLK